MCWKIKPEFKELSLSREPMRVRLAPIGASQIQLWDSAYWYLSHEDWGEVIRDVLLNMPKYTVDKFDCENFAMLTSARVSERYKLNTCGIAIGQSPWGYHGFNIFLSNKGVFYLEPQTGDVYPIEEDSGYKAEIIIMG